MLVFEDIYGHSIHLKENSIDGGYVAQYENTKTWSATFYLRGLRLSYTIDAATAHYIKNCFGDMSNQ